MSYRYFVASGLVVAALACAPTSGNLGTDTSSATSTGADGGATTFGVEVPAQDACASPPAADRRAEACWRWTCDGRAAASASTWNGDAASCQAGSLDPDAGARTLALVNLYRWFAGMPPVTIEPGWSPAAQACALVATANRKLSHEPPSSWACWSHTAYEASTVSLIANRSGPQAVAPFLSDPGNDATLVHRRWLLSDVVARIGVGSSDRYSCVVVDGATLSRELELDAGSSRPAPDAGAAPRWAAWPPPGPVPIALVTSQELDTIGWSIQSGEDDLDPATVVVASGGVALPTRATRLEPGLGSRSAVKIVPVGWTTAAGVTYDVAVSGASTHLAYRVEPFDCAL